jgi:hypothetical protein
VKGSIFIGVLCMTVGMSAAMVAQSRPAAAPAPRTAAELQARHQIFVMESVLEQAVQYGAQMLSDRLRTAGMPDMVMVAGAARARGFRLDGYGVFFDLEVPAVRRSVAWSLRMIGPDPRLAQALRALRSQVESVTDPRVKSNLEVLVSELESEVGPPAGARGAQQTGGSNRTGAVSAANVSGTAGPEAPAAAPPVDDPADVYTNEVRRAVIDAMFDHSGPINVAPSEWLTIAARADIDRRFLSGDPHDIPPGMVIRVRGADLTAFREGRLSRDEAIARVEVNEF